MVILSRDRRLTCSIWFAGFILPALIGALPLMAQEVLLFQQGAGGYSGCQDAHILANKTGWNTGAEEGLEATGNGGELDAKHGLFRFDLHTLPAETKIDSAWIEIYLVKRRTPQAAAKTLAVYRLNRPWAEGTGDDPGGYDGRPAANGEVSWQYASTPDLPWSSEGANHVPLDHAAQADDEHLIEPGAPAGRWYTWKVTDMVRFWISHADSNFGLLLREPTVSAQTGILNFASSQSLPDTLRPRLRIKLGDQILQTIAQTIVETHTSDQITVTWPYRGDADGDGHAEVSLARAGDAQWGAAQSMTKSGAAYAKTFSGLSHGLYHLRGWIYDPDGVQGAAIQTVLNIKLTPNTSQAGQLYTTLFSDNRLQVLLTFADDSNANNYAILEHKEDTSAVWLSDSLMSRSQGQFERVLAGLSNGQRYDLRVTLHDPDGVVGESQFMAQIYIPLSAEPVRILSSGKKSFHIQSGIYFAVYDSAQTGPFVWFFADPTQTVVLRCAIANGLPFSVLNPVNLDSLTMQENEERITAILDGHWNSVKHRVTLDFYKRNPGLFRWRCALQNGAALSVQTGAVECSFYDRDRKNAVSSNVESYVQQAPYCAGLTSGYEPQAARGTLFYFQNFSSLNDYFSQQHAAPEKCVLLNSTGFGFERPAGSRPLRDEPTAITDAFLYLTPGKPVSEMAIAMQFINSLSEIYERLDKPVPEQIDWPAIAGKTLQDLQDERCLATVYGEKYFRSYVGVPRLHNAEAIAQLDVLVALRRYELVFGSVSDLDDRLSQNLYRFYNQEHHTMVNDVPNEGVQEGDSWYAVHVHLGLGALAKMGDPGARTLFFLSLPKLIAFARQVNYEFPVFFRYGDNSAISGREPDATGGFIYAMLDAYELSRDPAYLQEAKAACDHISGYGFDYTYEVHMTAATCAALARLYKITGEPRFLELSYMPFANLMALTWLWECDYGYARDYRTFFGLSPMAGASVITPMEGHHSWTYLCEYHKIAGADLPPALLTLLDGFIAYVPEVMKYALPPFLPSAAFFAGPTVYDSYNIASFYIPLEDLRDGWQKSGSLGQQIYGAGGPFVFAAGLATGVEKRAKADMDGPDLALLQNYPNPFNGGTLVKYRVPGSPGQRRVQVSLSIHDVLGRSVKTLLAEAQHPGVREIRWDGQNEANEIVSAGVYFLVMQMDGQRSVKKILLLR